jgi:hypothetical protein
MPRDELVVLFVFCLIYFCLFVCLFVCLFTGRIIYFTNESMNRRYDGRQLSLTACNVRPYWSCFDLYVSLNVEGSTSASWAIKRCNWFDTAETCFKERLEKAHRSLGIQRHCNSNTCRTNTSRLDTPNRTI